MVAIEIPESGRSPPTGSGQLRPHGNWGVLHREQVFERIRAEKAQELADELQTGQSQPAASAPRIGAGTVHLTLEAVYGAKSQVGPVVGVLFLFIAEERKEMLGRILKSLLVMGLLTGTSWAANDPFVGRWKLNPSRSTLTDEMKVTKVGENKYAFELGGGEPETIVVDGTFQPGMGGTTLSVAAEGPNWKVIRKKDGRMLLTARWTLSKDGSSLTDDFTSFGQDGSPSYVKYLYKRTAGDRSGFAGTWVSTNEMVNSAITLQISLYEGDGLSLTSAAGTTNLKFDGASARRPNASAIEVVQRSDGKVILTKQYKLSPDLKTLTITTHVVGHTTTNTFVFERL